jgi:hypothetical protein
MRVLRIVAGGSDNLQFTERDIQNRFVFFVWLLKIGPYYWNDECFQKFVVAVFIKTLW